MKSENELKEDVGDVPTKKACVAGLGSEISPIFNYVSSLSGEAFANVAHRNVGVISELQTSFNWFCKFLFHSQLDFRDIPFEEALKSVHWSKYPRFVLNTFRKSKTYKLKTLKQFKAMVEYFYCKVFGADRLFDFLKDPNVGVRVVVHQNALRFVRSQRFTGVPFYVIVEELAGYLEAIPQSELMIQAGHDSVMYSQGLSQLLFGLLRFLPHHCDSALAIGGRTEPVTLFGREFRSVGLVSRVENRMLSFKVGDEINVFYAMGSNKSSYNFACMCGSPNCVSLK